MRALSSLKNHNFFAPFGMVMDGRSYTAGSAYRYGFNGKEADVETGLQDYGFRIYNQGICKFLSVDPLTKDYPWYSPYQFSGNSPIAKIDLDGLEPADPNAPQGEPSAWAIIKEYSDYFPMQKGTLLRIVDNVTLDKYWVFRHDMVNGGNTYEWYSKAKSPGFSWQIFEPSGYINKGMVQPAQTDFGKQLAWKSMGNGFPELADYSTKFVQGSTMAFVTVGTLGGGLALEGVMLKAGISTLMQAVAKGEIDIADVTADGCLMPGFSAVAGGAVDFTLTPDGFNYPAVVGINKSGNQFMMETANSAIWGGLGTGATNAVGGAMEEVLGKKVGDVVSEIIIGTPASAGEQGIEKVVIDPKFQPID